MVFRRLEQVLLVYYQLQQTSLFSVMLLQSQLLHGGSAEDLLPGVGCSLVLRCLHNSHSCTYSSEQYFVYLLRISFSSVKHFPDLSWIVEELPCFSTILHQLICSLAVVFVQASFNLLALSTYPVQLKLILVPLNLF